MRFLGRACLTARSCVRWAGLVIVSSPSARVARFVWTQGVVESFERLFIFASPEAMIGDWEGYSVTSK